MLHLATILASGAPAPIAKATPMHEKRGLIVGGAPTQRIIGGGA